METVFADLDYECQETYVKNLDDVLKQLNLVAHKYLAQRLKRENLTVSQLATMRVMQKFNRSCSMSELAEAAYQVSPTITGIINRLEERKFVQREQNQEDRRSYKVSLTPDAVRLLEDLDREKQQRLSSIINKVSIDSRKEIMFVLHEYFEIIKSDISNYHSME